MSRIRTYLSYANVMATVAVFVALGGVGYAAATLPKNSVGNAQLKSNAVSGAKVKNSSLTGSDIRNRSLTASDFNGSLQGPPGTAGPRGEKGETGAAGATGAGGATNVVVRTQQPCPNLPANAHCAIVLQCQAGERATGGGAGFTDFAGNEIVNVSHPLEANGTSPEAGDVPTGWTAGIEYTAGGPRDAVGYVICASP